MADPVQELAELLGDSWITRVKACPICCVLVLREHLEQHTHWHISTMTTEQAQATAAELLERLADVTR